MRKALRFMAALFVLGAVVATAAQDPNMSDMVVVAKKVPAPPVIDGRLDDACWQTAAHTGPFRVLEHVSSQVTGLMEPPDPKFVEHAAEAFICHDDRCLYVAFRAPAPDDTPAKASITAHGGRVWNEDCVQLFVAPGRQMGFYQIVVNAIGSVADISNLHGVGDMNWDANADVKAQKDGAGFTVEMAIPFSAFGDGSHDAGMAWGINFCREGQSGGGPSTWAPVGRNFETPERFGVLVFDSLKAYYDKELDRLDKSLAVLPKERSLQLSAAATRLMGQLRTQARGEDMASWARVHGAIAEVEGLMRQIALSGRSYLFWQKDVWGPVSPDEKVPMNVRDFTSLDLVSGQNTRVVGGFLATNLGAKPLMGRLVLVEPDDKSPLPAGAAVLPRDRVTFQRAIYIELNNGIMVPDGLVAMPPMNLLEVPPRTTTLVWVEIDTQGLAPGKYARRVSFSPSYSGFDPTNFVISLEVAPVDLAAPDVPQFTYLDDINGARFPSVARDLVRHGVNTLLFLPGRDLGYPALDAEGNIVAADFSALDKMVNNFLEAGVPLKRLRIVLHLDFNDPSYKGLCRGGSGQLKYGTPQWKKGLANSLRAIRDHLFERGLSYAQVIFYIYDEPRGDPADPTSGAYQAQEGARYVKEVDTKFRLMTNPRSDQVHDQWLASYFPLFDILEPHRPHLDSNPAAIRIYQNSGREIWTYSILANYDTPATYRRTSWQSARDGFTGVCAFWNYDSYAGDPFNSHDCKPDNPKRVTDYCVMYLDTVNKRLTGEPGISSRRWEASYQGNQDFRTIVICRELISELKTAGHADAAAKYAVVLNQAILDGIAKPAEGMDEARVRLIRAAVEMKRLLGR